MRSLLLLLILLLSGSSVFAQTTARPTPADSVALATPAPDTVAAIHRLFAAKRKTRALVVIGTLAGGAVVTTTGFLDSAPYADAGAAVFGAGILIAAITELLFYRRYRHAHEQKIIDSYQSHNPPRWLARKLHGAHFQSATSEAAITR